MKMNRRTLILGALTLTSAGLTGLGQSAMAADPALRDLSLRFRKEVPDTVTFAFNSAKIEPAARPTLAAQAAFIRQYPAVRFTVAGFADRVGSQAYNQELGLRRANAALDYLVAQGVNRAQLEAIVSFGEDRPVIETETEERRNRRVVTAVAGYLEPDCNCRKRPGVEG